MGKRSIMPSKTNTQPAVDCTWRSFDTEKPDVGRRIEVGDTQARGHNVKTGVVTCDRRPGEPGNIFRPDDYHINEGSDWPHGYYFSSRAKWRYLPDATVYHDQTEFSLGLQRRPSLNLIAKIDKLPQRLLRKVVLMPKDAQDLLGAINTYIITGGYLRTDAEINAVNKFREQMNGVTS